jgi:RimJ/RimL family protein N-acetyltransferase
MFSYRERSTDMLSIKSWWQSLHKAVKISLIAIIIGCASGLAAYYFNTSHVAHHDRAPAEVRGSIVTLKTLKEDYFAELHNMFSNACRKGLDFPAVTTFGYTIAYLRELERRAKTTKGIHYVIFDNADNKPIGSIEVREYDPEDYGQMGVWINENYWGGGRTVEAIKLIGKAYFELYPEAKDFIAFARPWNQRSYKALQKAGFVDEGFKYVDGTPLWYQLRMHRKTLI